MRTEFRVMPNGTLMTAIRCRQMARSAWARSRRSAPTRLSRPGTMTGARQVLPNTEPKVLVDWPPYELPVRQALARRRGYYLVSIYSLRSPRT